MNINQIIVDHGSNHHSSFSGYRRIISHINADIVPSNPEKIPYRIRNFFCSKFVKNNIYYNSQSVEKEYQIFLKILHKKREKFLIHNLNGERDLRYTLKFLSSMSSSLKFISSFHKPIYLLEKIFKMNPYIKRIDGAIALGSNQRDFLINKFPSSKIKLIHHGVDTDFFKPRKKYIENKRKSILLVGQHLRDFELFNRVVDEIKNNNIDLNVVIHPSYIQFLRNKKFLNIFSGISNLKLKSLYQESSCLFIPFKNVVACNSILESLACGTPIITNVVGDYSDYLDNNCAIFANDKDSLIDSIMYIINTDQRKKMSLEARKKASEFDFRLISKKIQNFYHEMFL